MTRVWTVMLVVLLGYMTYQVFAPFIVPLAWGLVLATIFYRAHTGLLERIKRPNGAAFLTTLLITLVIIVPAILVGAAFTKQAVQFGSEIQADWVAGKYPVERLLQWGPIPTIAEWVDARGITTDEIVMYAKDSLGDVASFVAGQLGNIAKNVVIFLFNLFLTLFATFYLLRDGSKLLERIRTIMPGTEGQREDLLVMAYNVLYASVLSSFVVAAVQGLLGGIVFWALGVGKPLLWGVVMGFLALLPMVGSWLVWAPVAISLALTGQYVRALILVLIGAGIIGTADNVLRPMLISGRVQLNGLLVFISVLGGIAAFGVIGLVLGPILVAVGQATLEFYAQRRKEETSAQASSA